MAKSGYKSVAVTKWDTLKFSWEIASQSVANNTSTVSWKMELIATDYGRISASSESAWSITVNGTNYTGKKNIGISNNATKTLASGTTTIAHTADGSKSFNYSFSQTMNITFSGEYIGTVSGSGSGTLDKIPRAATLTSAPNFNDEANPKIVYSNPAGSAATTLQACIASSGGDTIYCAYRDISKSGTEYTFSLTAAERTTLRNAAKNSKSITVKFYVKTVIGSNTYYSSLSKTLSIVNANPTVNPTITDTNSVTTGLTGDSNKLIRYFSNVSIAFGASALKGASISSRKVESGSKSLTADGTINAVESGTFKFTVKDSRGNTTTKTVTKSIVNYVKLTCGLSNTGFNTDGVISFTVKGNYFSGSFGATSNTLTVQYRYKLAGGSYSSWTATQATVSSNTYSANITISGLDYQKKYVIQARAVDKLITIASSEKTMACVPVFDWGAEDFNFNVPVTMNHNGNTYNLLGLFRAMTTTYTPACDVTPGANYSSATVTAHLTGCNLRIGLSATRSASLAAGNFDNETVCTVDIDHGGKLANLYRVSFNTSTSGGVATLDCQATKVNDNVVRITINLCAAAHNLTSFNAYFAMPCTIVTKAYV
jgi:hypothetical protein